MRIKKNLPQSFFKRPVLDVSQDLLGKYLVRSINGQEISLVINEVEAYDGPDDLACHASVGKTNRNAPLFGPAGHYYVYFVYGVHWLLNIVTGDQEYPAGILIRGAGEVNGPARVTKFLGINKQFNMLPVCKSTGLWVQDRGDSQHGHTIIRTPRIGVAYAGPVWSKVPYRFVLK